MKAVMLGLDGLSPQILTNALKKAELPNLQRIISKGEAHTLVSIPPVTPIEWTSIATGMNPAKHGIWGFTKIYMGDGGRLKWRYYQSYDVRQPRIFEITAFKGLETLCINYPLTWPIKGNWYLEHLDIVGDTLISPRTETNAGFIEKKYLKYFEPLPDPYKKTVSYIKGLEGIIEEKEYDFVSIVLPFPDQAFHKDAKEVLNIGKKSKATWEEIDSLLDIIAKKATKVFIVSDHGLGAYRKYANPLEPILRYKWIREAKRNPMLLLSAATDFYSYATKIPIRIFQRKYFKEMLYKLSLRKDVIISAGKGAWKGAEASSVGSGIFYDMHDPSDVWIVTFLNETSRERFLEALRKDKASEYVDVRKTEEVFKGNHFTDLPSAIVMPKLYNKVYLNFATSLFLIRYDIISNHHVLGVFILNSPNIDKNANKKKALLNDPLTTYDVTPSILSYLGLPIPKGTDGRSIGGNTGFYAYDIGIKLRRMRQKIK